MQTKTKYEEKISGELRGLPEIVQERLETDFSSPDSVIDTVQYFKHIPGGIHA